MTHLCHPYLEISFLSLLPGTAEGGWKRQRCVTLTLPHKLFFFKGLMRVIRKIEMREMNFWCAVIAQNFLLIFYLCKIGRKLHKEHSFWKETRKSMSLDGSFKYFLLLAVAENAFLLIFNIFEWPQKASKLWVKIPQIILVQIGLKWLHFNMVL